MDTVSLLGRCENRLERIQAEVFIDLLAYALRIGSRQVDLVNHRHDLQIVLERQVEVGDRLRFDPLGSVDQ